MVYSGGVKTFQERYQVLGEGQWVWIECQDSRPDKTQVLPCWLSGRTYSLFDLQDTNLARLIQEVQKPRKIGGLWFRRTWWAIDSCLWEEVRGLTILQEEPEGRWTCGEFDDPCLVSRKGPGQACLDWKRAKAKWLTKQVKLLEKQARALEGTRRPSGLPCYTKPKQVKRKGEYRYDGGWELA